MATVRIIEDFDKDCALVKKLSQIDISFGCGQQNSSYGVFKNQHRVTWKSFTHRVEARGGAGQHKLTVSCPFCKRDFAIEVSVKRVRLIDRTLHYGEYLSIFGLWLAVIMIEITAIIGAFYTPGLLVRFDAIPAYATSMNSPISLWGWWLLLEIGFILMAFIFGLLSVYAVIIFYTLFKYRRHLISANGKSTERDFDCLTNIGGTYVMGGIFILKDLPTSNSAVSFHAINTTEGLTGAHNVGFSRISEIRIGKKTLSRIGILSLDG